MPSSVSANKQIVPKAVTVVVQSSQCGLSVLKVNSQWIIFYLHKCPHLSTGHIFSVLSKELDLVPNLGCLLESPRTSPLCHNHLSLKGSRVGSFGMVKDTHVQSVQSCSLLGGLTIMWQVLFVCECWIEWRNGDSSGPSKITEITNP